MVEWVRDELSTAQLDDRLDALEGEELPERTSAIEAKIIRPDPGGTPFWHVQSDPDRTYADVFVHGYTGDAWSIVKDGLEPTYPDDFTESDYFPGRHPRDSFAAEVWEFWQYVKTTATKTEILDIDGISGIEVLPTDVNPPTASTIVWQLNPGTDTTTDIEVVLPTFSDSGSGYDQTDLYHWDVNGNHTLYRQDITHATTTNITNNTPGETLDIFPRAFDNAGNALDLGHKEITLDSAATAGEVNLSAIYYEGTEGTPSTITATLQWTGTGSNPAFDVDVSTVEYASSEFNAEAGVNYTTLSAQTVSFTASVPTKAQTISLTDVNATSNLWLGIVIDSGSATASVEIGAVNGANCLILGTGASGTGFLQDSTSDNLLVIRGHNMTEIAEGSDSFIDYSNTRSNDSLSVRSQSASATYGSDTVIGDGTGGPSVSSVPYRQAAVVWNVPVSNDTVYGWMRMWYNSTSSSRSIHASVDDSSISTLLNFQPTAENGADNHFYWVNHEKTTPTGTVRQSGAVVNSGAGTVEAVFHDGGAQLDTLLFTTNASYDPRLVGDPGDNSDDSYGPSESAQGSGGDLPTGPVPPLPVPPSGGGTLAVTLSPANSATISNVNVNPQVSYPTGSAFSNSAFTITAGGVPKPGTVALTDTSATFVPSSPFDNSAGAVTVACTAIGSGRDENGVIKDYDTTAAWSFTISASSGLIVDENFNDLAVGTVWADVMASRLTLLSGFAGSESKIFADPLGDSSRGNVLGVFHPANTTGSGGGLGLADMQIDISSGVGANTTVYMAYDIMVPTINPISGNIQEIPLATKLPGLAGANPINNVGAASGGSQPTGVVPSAWSARLQRMRFNGDRQTGKLNIAGYLYAADPDQDPATDTAAGCSDTYYNQCLNRATETNGDRYAFPYGQWVTIESSVTLNTVPATGIGNPNGGSGYPNYNGTHKLWIDGVLKATKSSVPWRVGSIPINICWFTTGHGGSPSNPIFWPSEDYYTYYDNLRVSLSPITH